MTMSLCRCGHQELENKKEISRVKVHLNNPGIVNFEAPVKKCSECGEMIFHEEDAETIFENFEKGYEEQKLK